MTSAFRSILHVDMDAFYASIEQRDNPELRGKPLVVGGTSNRGVVAAASYEARQFGIRSAMPMRDACRRCPDLLQVRTRMSHYQAVSKQIFEVFRSFTPYVEGLSLDEAFLDVTTCVKLFGAPVEIARSIKEKILDETGLTASVGVAENKLVAKIASDLEKPDGLTVVLPADYETRLDPLPAAVIPGIGKETLRRLSGTGIRTIRDLRTAENRILESIFGRFAQKTRLRASGIDDRPVVSSRAEKSISAEETYDHDLETQVKIRQPDLKPCTRQKRMNPPASGTDQIYSAVRDLLDVWLAQNPGTKVRLLGVGGSNLAPAAQPDLFAAGETETLIDKTADEIRDRFGNTALGRARTLDRH